MKSEHMSSSFESDSALITKELQVAELNGKKGTLVVFILTGTPSRRHFVLPPFCCYLLDKDILRHMSGGFLEL